MPVWLRSLFAGGSVIGLTGSLEIGALETSLELAPRLSVLGADLIMQALSHLEGLVFTPQDHG